MIRIARTIYEVWVQKRAHSRSAPASLETGRKRALLAIFVLLFRRLHRHSPPAPGADISEQFRPADEDVVMPAERAVMRANAVRRHVIDRKLRRILASLAHFDRFDINQLAALAAGINGDA